MKNKLGIKARIFVTFSFFIFLVINLFAGFLYYLVSQKFIENTVKNIQSEYQTITNFIDIQKQNVLIIPEYEVKNINSLGFFLFIGNNDQTLQNTYKLGLNYYNQEKNIIYRGDYRGHNIVIGKKLDDLIVIKDTFIDVVILLDIILIGIVFIITYFLSIELLKPLSDIEKAISKYDVDAPTFFLTNEYGDSEIGKYIQTTNNFLQKMKSIFASQKDFIQDVSHELKTPLMQINSSIEMIESRTKDEKILVKLENIRSGSASINAIVSNLSFLLRGEEKLTQKQKIDFGEYFENKLPQYQALAKGKNISLQIIKDADLIIESNAYYIDRIFDNIVSNAIFYNNGGNEIILTIGTNFISVKDFGIGMDQTEISKIFNRFYRNDTSVMYQSTGSGLGLSIVKKITHMFGWELKVFSEKGKGSEFIIYFVK